MLTAGRLAGTLPAYGANSSAMPALSWLGLYGAGLTGTVPASLGNMSQMRGIYLFGNHLTGEGPWPAASGRRAQPTDVKSCMSAQSAAIPGAKAFGRQPVACAGTLPPWSGSRMPQLKTIYLQDNDLSGMLPGSFSRCGGHHAATAAPLLWCGGVRARGAGAARTLPQSLRGLTRLPG